nr:MAG TPA: hypothetical protein [Caudoviricetes sp.]
MGISRNRDKHHGFLFCKNTHFERLETGITILLFKKAFS